MSARILIILAALALVACGRGDGSTVGMQTALYRIERGGYAEVELRPQFIRLVTADGQEQKSFWRGGQMAPRAKSEVDMRVLKARARGYAITYITGGEPDARSPGSQPGGEPGDGAGDAQRGVDSDGTP